jgi:hypothetical protein
VDVASVGAVDPATLAATDLINILKVIGSSFTAIPNDYLAVLVHETDGGCALFHDAFRFLCHVLVPLTDGLSGPHCTIKERRKPLKLKSAPGLPT